MTVAQFQKIHEINSTTPDTVERLGWIICDVFDYTEDQVNHMSKIKFVWLVNRLERKLNAKPSKWCKGVFNTDAESITLGQFIECQHWLKNDAIRAMDLVAASILYERNDHKQDADAIRKMPFKNVFPFVTKFVESFNQLILSYKGLFEINIDEDEEMIKPEKQHPFIENYAWIFSAKEVAAHEGITLNQAFELPVIQAFNDLSYLKSKQDFDKKQAKQ